MTLMVRHVNLEALLQDPNFRAEAEEAANRIAICSGREPDLREGAMATEINWRCGRNSELFTEKARTLFQDGGKID